MMRQTISAGLAVSQAGTEVLLYHSGLMHVELVEARGMWKGFPSQDPQKETWLCLSGFQTSTHKQLARVPLYLQWLGSLGNAWRKEISL